MADMISVATGFQSSVNIAYDINDEAKLKNYIPTKSALKLLEDILLSTGKESTDRARILIGAYGKGKSHIVLMILSILMKKDITLFEKLIPVIEKEKPELYQLIKNYYAGKGKILPVVISGSSNSLAQAFLLALQRTLAENELNDIMPETNYQAAVNTIQRWKGDFPDTYELTYKDENGKAVTKRFAKVEESRRGKLLYNAIISQLDSMGQAIPEQEKRQILMEVLKEMC